MKPGAHLLTSMAGGVAAYWFFESMVCAAIFFASSIFIDFDHLIDYMREFGLKDFKVRIFLLRNYDMHFSKVWFVFHSLELLLLLWGVITVLKLNQYWVSFASGLSFHMALDCLFNPVFAFSYFFTYRWRNQFRTEKIFYKNG